NILVFALWYWRLDAGGPHGREAREGHAAGAFLFPQMTMSPQARTVARNLTWSPDFVDYLFLAFNTSTAFSPTDTPVLARWGKVAMMIQSLISLTVLAILAARGKDREDRKSTRLNSSHLGISYAVFCLKKKTITD